MRASAQKHLLLSATLRQSTTSRQGVGGRTGHICAGEVKHIEFKLFLPSQQLKLARNLWRGSSGNKLWADASVVIVMVTPPRHSIDVAVCLS